MPQLTTAANATTPVPISSRRDHSARAASRCAADSVGIRDADAAGGAFGKRTAVQSQGRPDLTQRRRTELIPEPVMRSRTSPRSRGPIASNSGASAAGPYRVPVSHETPPFRQPFTGVSSLGTLTPRKRRKEGTWLPAVGEKAPDFHAAARRRRYRIARRFQGPQARPLFLSQGRHARLHQGGDRLQRPQARLRQGRDRHRRRLGRPRAAQDKFRDKHELTIALASDEDEENADRLWGLGREIDVRPQVHGGHAHDVPDRPDGRIAQVWENVKVAGPCRGRARRRQGAVTGSTAADICRVSELTATAAPVCVAIR